MWKGDRTSGQATEFELPVRLFTVTSSICFVSHELSGYLQSFIKQGPWVACATGMTGPTGYPQRARAADNCVSTNRYKHIFDYLRQCLWKAAEEISTRTRG